MPVDTLRGVRDEYEGRTVNVWTSATGKKHDRYIAAQR